MRIREAILNKDFTLLFSLDKRYFREQFLSELSSLDLELFANDIHYSYYKEYFLKSLSGLPESISTKVRVYVSPSYLYIDIISRRKDYGWSYDSYLIGFDSNGRLFINGVTPVTLEEKVQAIYVPKKLTIYEVDDKEILYRVIRVDGQQEGYVLIDGEGRYRVQGEVVVQVVRTAKDLEEMLKLIGEESIHNYLRNWIHERIAFLLINLGFNVEVNVFGHIVLDGVVREMTPQEVDSAVRNLINIIFRRLKPEMKELVEVEGLRIRKEKGVNPAYRAIMRTKNGDLHLHLEVRREGTSLEMFVRRGVESLPAYRALLEDFVKRAKGSKRDFHFYIGNHRVEVKNSISASMVYRPPLKPLNLFLTEDVHIGRNVYIMDRDGEAVLTHPDHPTTTIRFLRPAIVFFDTINVSRAYLADINKIVISKLLKS